MLICALKNPGIYHSVSCVSLCLTCVSAWGGGGGGHGAKMCALKNAGMCLSIICVLLCITCVSAWKVMVR